MIYKKKNNNNNNEKGSEMVKALLRLKADVNKVDVAGYTALHWASACGTVESVKQLLDADSSIDVKNVKTGETPLHRAVRY
jgi:ankyrin repeat protein